MKQGWEIKKLGEVCQIINGGTPDTTISEFWEGENLWITPKDMGKLNGRYVDETERCITDKGLQNSSAKILPIDSVILSSRAPIGHLAINKKPISTNQGCKGLIPQKELNTLYLYYFLSGSIDLLNDLGSGTTFKELSGKSLSNVTMPIPSILEQERIVGILDSAFAKIEALRANAQQNLQNTKDLFQASLKQELIPKQGWITKTLSECSTIIGDGIHGTPSYSSDGEYYFINGNNLNIDKIEIKDATKKVHVKEFNKYKVELNENTVFVSINGTLGKTAFYNNEPIILGKSACYINVTEMLSKEFLRYIFISDMFLSYAHKNATGATIKNLGLKAMRLLPINLPPIIEQSQIVEKLDALSERCRAMEENYRQTIAHCNALKQALLTKAFNGKL